LIQFTVASLLTVIIASAAKGDQGHGSIGGGHQFGDGALASRSLAASRP
jgi:hypothetical protein